eukprot:3031797-Rhodomonas_salina.1
MDPAYAVRCAALTEAVWGPGDANAAAERTAVLTAKLEEALAKAEQEAAAKEKEKEKVLRLEGDVKVLQVACRLSCRAFAARIVVLTRGIRHQVSVDGAQAAVTAAQVWHHVCWVAATCIGGVLTCMAGDAGGGEGAARGGEGEAEREGCAGQGGVPLAALGDAWN